MRRTFVGRIVAVSLAVGVISPVAATIAGSGTNAFASGQQITCTKLSGNASTQKLSNCTGPTAILGTKVGKGTGTSTLLGTAPAGYQEGSTTTWGKKGAGGTSTSGTNITSTTAPGKGTPCGKKAETLVEAQTVLSGTGAAASLAGDTSTGTVCYDGTTNKVSLPKHGSIGS
jgi:hypothetical protein